jgi:hypothetical protein
MVSVVTKLLKVSAKRKVSDFLVKEKVDRVHFYYQNSMRN